ncbi:uncharacterized protein LOC132170183 [Corylus avellana]|uniref:uncharacterized protein LOC132170183 n=1 Tax=Corylus avellana TaxID=13451 RepID=UPI001E1EFCB4|nr:uncharacterized protein LOC132170183 [Corylus avellana]
MGGEDQDSTVIHSSIALLQERFRQLQRVKEMREERELMRMLAEPNKHLNLHPPPMPSEQPSKLFFHSELIIPPRSPPQASLSISPPSQSRRADYPVRDTPLLVNSWRHTDDHRSSVNEFNDSDSDHSKVDTSLHL